MFSLRKYVPLAVLGVACVGLGRAPAQEPRDGSAGPRVEASRTIMPPADPDPACPEKARPADVPAPARSQNYLRGIGNGVGNSITIDNGGGSSTTVIENARNGVGNRLVIVDGQVVTDTTTPAPAPAPGAGQRFGDLQFYSPAHGCTLYWSPRTLTWYRYDSTRRDYVPAEWDF